MTYLQILEKSTCFENAYPQRKEPGLCYATVEVISCESEQWWYRDLIEWEFFCRLVFFKNHRTGLMYLEDARVCRITKTQIIYGRSFSPKDITIL